MAVDLQITLEGITQALQALSAVSQKYGGNMKEVNRRIATLVHDTAVEYAPRSPNRGDVMKARAAAALGKRKARPRNPRAFSRENPGGLETSIDFGFTPEYAEVFVSANAPAGAYAWKIHEERYVSWQNRGAGTRAKGAQAREKFITRAVVDNDGHIIAIIADEIDQLTRKAGLT